MTKRYARNENTALTTKNDCHCEEARRSNLMTFSIISFEIASKPRADRRQSTALSMKSGFVLTLLSLRARLTGRAGRHDEAIS